MIECSRLNVFTRYITILAQISGIFYGAIKALDSIQKWYATSNVISQMSGRSIDTDQGH